MISLALFIFFHIFLILYFIHIHIVNNPQNIISWPFIYLTSSHGINGMMKGKQPFAVTQDPDAYRKSMNMRTYT